MQNAETGKITRWYPLTQTGIIQPTINGRIDYMGSDVLLHVTALPHAQWTDAAEGRRCEYTFKKDTVTGELRAVSVVLK